MNWQTNKIKPAVGVELIFYDTDENNVFFGRRVDFDGSIYEKIYISTRSRFSNTENDVLIPFKSMKNVFWAYLNLPSD